VGVACWQIASFTAAVVILLPLQRAAANPTGTFSGCWQNLTSKSSLASISSALRSNPNGQVVCFGSFGRVKITTFMGHMQVSRSGRIISTEDKLLIDFPVDETRISNIAWPAFAESVLCEWQMKDLKSLLVSACFAVNTGKPVGSLDLQKDNEEMSDLEWAK
jgi:hypothetical protein